MADVFGDISAGLGAASDIFGGLMGASGDAAAQKAYEQAAQYAQKNAVVAQRSGALQEAQLNRQIYQTVSGATAAEAANGLGTGGSNQYIQRANMQQGGLAKAIVNNQTQLNVQGYEAEAAADVGQAKQAAAAGQSSGVGGILGAVGSILSIF